MTTQNRKTNLGMILLLTATLAFGAAAAVSTATLNDGLTTPEAFRIGVAAGIVMAAALALATYSVLVIRKAKTPVAA